MRLPINAAPVDRSPKTMQSLGAGRITPSFDVWCMVKCLGLSALKCIKCGTSVSCWIECAGPKAVACYNECK